MRYPTGRTTLVTGDGGLRLAALTRGVEALGAEALLQGDWRGRAGKLRR
ncbi:MAG: hypothetical protein HY814_08395 [Candidatus Riflebacteria bacterium]|nr:hypothetical protein [Candidatus Riflebacteria bacterium]